MTRVAETRARLRLLARHLPPSVRAALKRLAPRRPAEPAPPRAEPAYDAFRALVAAHADDLAGDVLVTAALRDLEAPTGARVLLAGVDPRDTALTVVADLAEPGSLPPGRFDCVLLPEPSDAARANAWQALRPGGTLLAGDERTVKDA